MTFKRSSKVTQGHRRSPKVKNRYYTQIKGNRECNQTVTFKRSSKVIQGHERSKIDILVKIRLRQEFDVPDSRGGGVWLVGVGGVSNFAAARIAYSECEYISVFN